MPTCIDEPVELIVYESLLNTALTRTPTRVRNRAKVEHEGLGEADHPWVWHITIMCKTTKTHSRIGLHNGLSVFAANLVFSRTQIVVPPLRQAELSAGGTHVQLSDQLELFLDVDDVHVNTLLDVLLNRPPGKAYQVVNCEVRISEGGTDRDVNAA